MRNIFFFFLSSEVQWVRNCIESSLRHFLLSSLGTHTHTVGWKLSKIPGLLQTQTKCPKGSPLPRETFSRQLAVRSADSMPSNTNRRAYTFRETPYQRRNWGPTIRAVSTKMSEQTRLSAISKVSTPEGEPL